MEPQPRPPLFLRLLPAWLVLESAGTFKASFLSSRLQSGRFLSFLFRFLIRAAISKPDVFQRDLFFVALKLAWVTELFCFPLAKGRNKIVVDG